MKKIGLLILCVSLMQGLPAVNKGIEDTSNVRYSTPEMRAEFLSQQMAKRLMLDEAQASEVREINLRYEKELQALVLDPPMAAFGARKHDADAFDQLTFSREKEWSDVMKRDQWREFEKKVRWSLRNELTKKVKADREVAEKKAAEEQAKALTDAANQKKEEERIAAEKAFKQSNKKTDTKKKSAGKKSGGGKSKKKK